MPSPFFDRLGAQVHKIFKNREKAVFKPNSGSTQFVEVIFNDRHQDIDIDGKPYGAPKPMAWVKTGEIFPEYNDVLEVNGTKYIIREMKDDGLELTGLVLSESVE